MTVETSAADAADATLDTTTDAAPSGAVSNSEAPGGGIGMGGTLLANAGAADDKPVAVPATWPDDWREKMAGEDAAYLNILKRYNSPGDVGKAHREATRRLSAGEVKKALPENPTPEELSAWRKENGLPETPDAYTPQLPNGVVLGEADQPLLKGFQEIAHKANMTPAQFNETLKWYYAEADALAAKQQETDREWRMQTEDDLRADFGAEYTPNLKGVNGVLNLYFGQEKANEILGSRTASGRMLGDDPQFIKSMALLARELNPAMPHIPVGNGNPMQATENRIGEIRKMMAEGKPEYWKDEKVQKEYRDLLDAQARLGGNRAA